MRTNLTRPSIYWLLAICGLFVLYYADAMWSLSSDLAHHYTLAYRISEQWRWALPYDPTLGEMNVYPRGSHTLAVIIGYFVGSTFLGMQITLLLALALLWMSAILILKSLRGVLATLSIISFTVLMILNATFIHLDIHGGEIIVSFFFAQLVGQSVFFLGMLLAIHLEKKRGIVWAVLLLTALMLVNASIHLLPVLETLGVIFGLLFVYVFADPEVRDERRRRCWIAVCITALASLSVMLHPAFWAMKEISGNDGMLDLNRVQYPYGLFCLVLAVGITSCMLYRKWLYSPQYKELIALKYCALYGGVVAALCFAQFILTFSGYGSDYAVKKYIFGLASILLLQVSIIVGGYISRKIDRNQLQFLDEGHLVAGCVLMGSLILILFSVVPRQALFHTSEVVSLERKLISLVDTVLPVPEAGKNNVAIGLHAHDMHTVDYMFSTALLKTDRGQLTGGPDENVQSHLTDLSKYAYIVSARSNPLYGATGCNTLAAGSLSIITSACLAQRQALADDCRSGFNFSKSGVLVSELIEGFGEPEEQGRWTDGASARLWCSNNAAPLQKMTLYVEPYLFGPLKRQRLKVFVNGVSAGEYELISRGGAHPLEIKIPQMAEAKEYRFEFKMPDATIPKNLEATSVDGRRLGFYFKKIVFE